MSSIYEIGPFRLDPDNGVLTRAGQPLALGARAVAVLATLVRQPQEFVQKAGILDAAWPGVVVEESNLAVQISAIRRAFSQVPGGERWIETLSRRGYRFIGPVNKVTLPLPTQAPRQLRSTNLPQPLTSFIGRERELAEIGRLLPGTRLLTIVGAGGIGKTRLALRAATDAQAAYRDGVWLVELAPLVDPAHVSSAVARVLGVREIAGEALLELLCSELKGRRLLLLLDNCEHLAASCARLAEALLRSAAELSIIASSREPLQIDGEQTYPLTALSLPDPAASAETMECSEAVRLFVERAQQQQSGFTLTAARAPLVADLCVRLDGIPLALELAAARLRSLSLEQINARLDDRFQLLTSGTRTALPRQQTLRATLDWSYDLLSEPERKVLRRVAIFSGGFTLDASSSVAADETTSGNAVLDILSQLVLRSLVVADTDVADARYSLLETMRAYALEKLVAAGETDSIRRRHAFCIRDRFIRAPEDWLRMHEEEWGAIYVRELDNVRAALDWAAGPGGDPALTVALAGASAPLWVELLLYGEGVQRLEAALRLAGPDTPEQDEARLWKFLGSLWGDGNALEKAAGAHRRAADLYRRLDDPLSLSSALVALARVFALMGQLECAASVFEEALSPLEQADVPAAWAGYYSGLGQVSAKLDDLTTARAHYERALSLYRRAGSERGALSTLNNLADMTWMLGDLDAALATSLEAVARLRQSPRTPKSTIGICLVNLAGVHVERGELDEALAASREGLPLLAQARLVWYPLDHLALRAALGGHSADAALLAGFTDAAYAARKMSRQPNEARASTRLQALLKGSIAAHDLERLLLMGAAIGDDEACRLALQE